MTMDILFIMDCSFPISFCITLDTLIMNCPYGPTLRSRKLPHVYSFKCSLLCYQTAAAPPRVIDKPSPLYLPIRCAFTSCNDLALKIQFVESDVTLLVKQIKHFQRGLTLRVKFHTVKGNHCAQKDFLVGGAKSSFEKRFYTWLSVPQPDFRILYLD